MADNLKRTDLKMPDNRQGDMMEALALTRSGRLAEASAFLQSLLRGSSAPVKPELVIEHAEPVAAPAQQRTGLHLPKALSGLLERLTPRRDRSGLTEPGTQPAPGAAPADGRFITKSYANQAGSRRYKLYIPSGYSGQASALIVMLHGCTQSPDDFAAGTRMNFAAEAHGCLVVYPEQPQTANASKCWNWFKPDDQEREQGEPSLIAGITREIMRDYNIDPRRVYVAGLSAGAAAAAVLGATYPDLYAAVGVHSGLACGAARDMPSALAAMRQGSPAPSMWSGAGRAVPTIVFHGDRDTTVHPSNGDYVIEQVAGGLTTSVKRGETPAGVAYERTLHEDDRGNVIHEQWVIHGAGHAWSGGSPAGSFTDPRGPDATAEMVRFFQEHRRQ